MRMCDNMHEPHQILTALRDPSLQVVYCGIDQSLEQQVIMVRRDFSLVESQIATPKRAPLFPILCAQRANGVRRGQVLACLELMLARLCNVQTNYGRNRAGLNLPVAPLANACLPLPACHEGKALEQGYVLLVFQQRAMQFGQSRSPVAAQIFGLQIFGQQQFQPIQNLGSRGFFLQTLLLSDLVKLR
mmetsp:Transcript_3665/g.6758  ORF Transcript_3665/g.6758 Transcript_3665/m.6758 type:complete len:188 (-) Transcript_3665:501-1064(-)